MSMCVVALHASRSLRTLAVRASPSHPTSCNRPPTIAPDVDYRWPQPPIWFEDLPKVLELLAGSEANRRLRYWCADGSLALITGTSPHSGSATGSARSITTSSTHGSSRPGGATGG